MRTPLCDELGIEFPIFAFTHCRDVVAAVSRAGGFGVLGAVGFTPEQLEVELAGIDEHVGDAPYGVDIVIAQGGEGGGHTGDVGSIVLWPQVAKAIAPTPMLAAGGIGSGEQIAAALALGAQGVWAGSLWLTVEEADLPPAQKQQLLDAGSRDTVRSRSFTGKPCRMLRSEWTEAWEQPDAPDPLPMPLQYMVSGNCVARGHRYADKAQAVMFNPVGQVVGQLNRVERTAQVVQRLVEEYLDACERLNRLNRATV
jgi:NAD(P)H-dependent flavin oxidoreductase YrpB (nitropropane dioxygenase family)